MWDIFISHASEDKDNLVRPLAKLLSEVYKVKVWYDEFTLEYGDSLLESIEKGLQNSTFGVVVFSQEFFNKVWTDHEYKSLKTKEMLLNTKVIIPIWYNIKKDEVAKYSYTLADKVAILLDDNFDIDNLAIKIIKVARPDIHENISRMRYQEQIIIDSKRYSISSDKFSKIPAPPVRHIKLSVHMEARLKLIYNSIKDVDRRSYEVYEEDFRRSTNIDREIIITELITSAYLDCIARRDMSLEEKINVYILILSLGKSRSHLDIKEDELNEFVKIIEGYLQNINAEIIMEYKFDGD